MTRRLVRAALPVIGTPVLVLTLTGCGASGSTSATATSSPAAAPTSSTSVPATSTAGTAATPQMPTTDEGTVPAGAETTTVTGDRFTRDAAGIVPGLDPAAARDLRTMTCEQLRADRSAAGAQTVVSSLVEQSGMDRTQATSFVRLAIRTGCPSLAGAVG